MKNFRLVLLAALPLFTGIFTTGCVTAGKYHDLEASKATSDQQLAECANDREDLQKKLGITSTQKTQLEGSVSDMKKALAEAEARKLETEKRLSEFRDLTAKFKDLVDAGKLTIKVRNGKMVIALSSDILFPSGSAKLSATGKLSIKDVASVLKEMNDKKFQIEGHTDNLPIHSKAFPSNWELASARAMTVLNAMLESGFTGDHVSVASFASNEPVEDNSTAEGRTANRRIDIVVVPDLSGLPGFDELNRMSKPAAKPADATAAPAKAAAPAKTDAAKPAASPAAPKATPAAATTAQ